MEVPYLTILIIYLIAIGIFMMLSFFNLYHLVKYSLFDLRSKIVLFLFLSLSIIVVIIPLILLREIDWWEPLFNLSFLG